MAQKWALEKPYNKTYGFVEKHSHKSVDKMVRITAVDRFMKNVK